MPQVPLSVDFGFDVRVDEHWHCLRHILHSMLTYKCISPRKKLWFIAKKWDGSGLFEPSHLWKWDGWSRPTEIGSDASGASPAISFSLILLFHSVLTAHFLGSLPNPSRIKKCTWKQTSVSQNDCYVQCLIITAQCLKTSKHMNLTMVLHIRGPISKIRKIILQ